MTEPDRSRRLVFAREAELYDAMRPSYPDAAIAALLARDPQRILEIGAGTGKLTRALARTGRQVIAIEPASEMAAVLRRHVAGQNVTVEEIAFEDFDGRDFDLVVAAQSLHWIEPAARYAKPAAVLRPGGSFAMVRNEMGAIDPELRRDFDAAYARWAPGPPLPTDRVAAARARWTSEIATCGVFATPEVIEVPWMTRYSTHAYVDLVRTYSDTIVLPEDRRRGLLEALAAAIERHGGHLDHPYVTLVIVATATS